MFAACNLIAAGIVYFFFIETNGKSLEQIDTMYLMHVPPRKSTRWEVPHGEDLVTSDQVAKQRDGFAGRDMMVENRA